jgi:AcrR family transcriptional regulator
MKKSYHHGNLREALLESARRILGQKGIEAVSLRAVAREAGVSAGAPYHHFADKAALLAALIERCFAELDRASRDAIVRHPDPQYSPQERLCALGVAYVQYALAHPAEFQIMFRLEKGVQEPSELGADTPVFGLLLQVIDELHAYEPAVDDPESDRPDSNDRRQDAIAAWSLVHGLAALLIDGPLHTLSGDPAQVLALVESVSQRLTLIAGTSQDKAV